MRAGRAHGDGKEVVVPCLTLDELELGRLDLIKVHVDCLEAYLYLHVFMCMHLYIYIYDMIYIYVYVCMYIYRYVMFR